MRKFAVLLAAAGMSLLVAGCATGGLEDVDPEDVSNIDFFGVIESIEPTLDEGEDFGGPSSQLLVGPAVLTLVDGRTLVFDGATRGGNGCVPATAIRVPTLCVVMGEFSDDGAAVDWFQLTGAAERVTSGVFSAGRVVDFHGRSAILQLPGDRLFASMPIAEDAVLSNCFEDGTLEGDEIVLPPAARYFALADTKATIVEIACVYGD